MQRCPLKNVLEAVAKLDGGNSANVSGWETCHVGGGARTLSLSPSGNYAFVACNSASKLCVVDTRKMEMICEIDVDSYPVGLALSNDGKTAIVTSQGRQGSGGNAVNIYSIEYAEPEPVIEPPKAESDSIEAAATAGTAGGSGGLNWWWIAIGAAVIVGAGLIYIIRKKK